MMTDDANAALHCPLLGFAGNCQHAPHTSVSKTGDMLQQSNTVFLLCRENATRRPSLFSSLTYSEK